MCCLNDNTVCVVGMGPIVNSNVDVDDLTTDQLRHLHRQIARLVEVGGTWQDSRSSSARLAPAPVPPSKLPSSVASPLAGLPPLPRDSSGTVVEKIQQTECHLLPGLLLLRRHTKFKALKVDGVEAKAERLQRLLQDAGVRACTQGRRRGHPGLHRLHDVRRGQGSMVEEQTSSPPTT